MEMLVETIIYLIITMGLILVVGSFFDVFRYNSILNDTYKKYICYDRRKEKEKFVEIIIHINNYESDEKEEILDKIKNGKFDDLNSIIDYLKVEETFDN